MKALAFYKYRSGKNLDSKSTLIDEFCQIFGIELVDSIVAKNVDDAGFKDMILQKQQEIGNVDLMLTPDITKEFLDPFVLVELQEYLLINGAPIISIKDFTGKSVIHFLYRFFLTLQHLDTDKRLTILKDYMVKKARDVKTED